jgi:hypothetical protein
MVYTQNYQLRKPVIGVDDADVTDLNFNSDKIDEIMHATQTSLAPAYDETETYNAGDVVMYEFNMYECIDDGVTGTWNPAMWTPTTAGEHGGGSDVEPNPTGEPTATLNKLGIEGTIYGIEGSGGGNVYGAFIDTNRVIQAETSVGSSDTYTATQDCMVVILLPIGNHNTYVYIDGVKVINMSGMANTYYDYTTIPLKEGQVMTFDFGSTNGYITVYGLTFGTQNIFTPQIYSTEERCVGVWIDNKPLYCKTWDLQTTVTLPSGGYTLPNDIQTDLQDAEIIVSGFAIRSTSNNATIPLTVYNANGVKNCLYVDSWGDVSKFTFYYTKTTDTAGSGSFNTLGVPMVHYSTDEQVVGTWIDGKTIYQKTCNVTTNTNCDNTTWTSLPLDNPPANADYMVDAELHEQCPNTNRIYRFQFENGVVKIASLTSEYILANTKITFRYTKSSS